ncbi:MAG TPA: hypothetical protein VGO32_02070 [Candidatus Limnocylindria bacterium]|jgi:hypothetical protein|nr:hypothetical protein [Candidatus Limnocylindria bacterium]
MSDRFDLDQALDAALTDLSTAIGFPPTPAMASAVANEVRSIARDQAPRWRPTSLPYRRAMLLATAAVLILVGAVGAIGIGIGAIQIRFADGSPLPTPLASVPNRGFGQPATLADAQDAVPFDVRVSADPALGEPDAVYLAAVPEGGTVTLAWGERPGYPVDARGVGLVVTEFAADIGPDTFEKMILEGTSVEPVTVNGRPGWWIEGGVHAFFYRDASGRMVDTTLRLVSSALIWEEDGLALRVEGAPDLAAAMRAAASLE